MHQKLAGLSSLKSANDRFLSLKNWNLFSAKVSAGLDPSRFKPTVVNLEKNYSANCTGNCLSWLWEELQIHNLHLHNRTHVSFTLPVEFHLSRSQWQFFSQITQNYVYGLCSLSRESLGQKYAKMAYLYDSSWYSSLVFFKTMVWFSSINASTDSCHFAKLSLFFFVLFLASETWQSDVKNSK